MRKAIIGAGYTTGVAQDISRASGWLCVQGVDGASILLGILGETALKPSVSVVNNNSYSFKNVCVLSCGPSVIDILVSELKGQTGEDKKSQIELSNIDAPMLLIGLTANAIKEFNLTIEVVFSTSEAITFSPSTINLADSLMNLNVVLSSGVDAIMKCSKAKNTNQIKEDLGMNDEKKSILISEETIRLLDTFAAKTYVPASEASRLAGAGAGLTDND